MSRFLCIGHAPLPHEPSLLRCSGNLRTWQFVRPLLDAGHEVRLVAARVHGSEIEGGRGLVEQKQGRLHYFSVGFEHFEDPTFLQRQHDAFAPDAIAGINNYPASRAVRIRSEKPIWCDLNGWAMAEAQTKAVVYGDDVFLSHFWNMEREILDRADVISTVSEAQRHALIGELASRGRLGRANSGYELCHAIPNALPENETPVEGPAIRGAIVPEEAFVLLWFGGYNTWADAETLARALELAMDALPDLFFLSTGGALVGHDDHTFGRFRGRIEGRGFDERLHFTGWLPSAEVPRYRAAADLGLNVDLRCYETLFGARNRINDMIAAGLPVLTTLGTEISLRLARENLVLDCAIGDAEQLARKIVWAHGNRDRLKDIARRASDFAHVHYSIESTTRPWVDWAADPRRAPDRGARVHLDPEIDFCRPMPEIGEGDRRSAEDTPVSGAIDALWSDPKESAEERCRRLEQRLDQITGGKLWRLWMLYLRLRRSLRLG